MRIRVIYDPLTEPFDIEMELARKTNSQLVLINSGSLKSLREIMIPLHVLQDITVIYTVSKVEKFSCPCFIEQSSSSSFLVNTVQIFVKSPHFSFGKYLDMLIIRTRIKILQIIGFVE